MEESVKPSATTMSSGIRFGLMLAIVSIAYFVLMNTLGMDTTQGPVNWITYLFYIAAIYLAHKHFKDNGDGYMTIGQGISIGFWLALISSIISSIFTYIYVKFIDTGFIQMILDRQREAMEKKGNLSDDQIDQAMSMTSKFMTPELMVVFALVGGIIVLVIFSILISLFTQKKNPEPFA